MRERATRICRSVWSPWAATVIAVAPLALAQPAAPERSESTRLRFIAHSGLEAGSLRHDRLYLRPGAVDTSVRATRLADLAGLKPAARDRAILQLEGPLTPMRHRALRDAGVRIEGHLPVNGFVVSLQNADATALEGLGFVRWAADFASELKLDPDLARREFQTQPRRDLDRAGSVALVITLFPREGIAPLRDWLQGNDTRGRVHLETSYAGSAVVHATMPRHQLAALTQRPEVWYIEHAPEITDRSNIDTSWIVQSNVTENHSLHDAGLTGEGQIIGILDSVIGGLDLNHCSFRDEIDNTPGPGHRKILAYNTAQGALTHATHVSATAAGHREPAAMDDTRGIAFNSKIVYSKHPTFDETAVYDALALHHSQGARIHTNSWGDDNSGWYTSLARGIDSFCYDFEDSFVGLAVTNKTELRTPENAKNLLAIGASGYPMESPSEEQIGSGGAGPTSDGRRKPEIYAPGMGTTSASAGTACSLSTRTGTSMASPAVCGTAVLVRQYYTDGYYPTGAAEQLDGFIPSGALVKATLLNGAVDMTSVPGFPSNQEGWGRLLADDALFFAGEDRALVVRDVWNATGLLTGEVTAHGLNVTSGGEPLKVTLAWTEPPAAPGAFVIQVNDLDLEVVGPEGEVYRGNVFAAGESITGGEPDDRNNVEQVLIPAPAIGDWTVRVRGSAINMGPQGYALVMTGDVQGATDPLAVALAQAPEFNPTGNPVPVIASIAPGSDGLVPDSVLLMMRAPGEVEFDPIAMNAQGGGLFTGNLPIVFCGDEVEYYVEVQGVQTGTVTDPPEAPDQLFTATITGADNVILFDDFESDQGWTSGAPEDTASTGAWVRVDPNPTTASPDDDHTPAGTIAWITQQALVPGDNALNSDVDSGFVTLLSPLYDLSSVPEAQISYWRWFYSMPHLTPQDTFRVDVTNDNQNWTNVITWGDVFHSQTFGGWIDHRFRVADFVAPNSQVRVRFRVEDVSSGTTVEGAVDDFTISEPVCVDVFCRGDANGDSVVNFTDVGIVLQHWLEISAPGAGALGDADHNGIVDFNDVTEVLLNWLAPCP